MAAHSKPRKWSDMMKRRKCVTRVVLSGDDAEQHQAMYRRLLYKEGQRPGLIDSLLNTAADDEEAFWDETAKLLGYESRDAMHAKGLRMWFHTEDGSIEAYRMVDDLTEHNAQLAEAWAKEAVDRVFYGGATNEAERLARYGIDGTYKGDWPRRELSDMLREIIANAIAGKLPEGTEPKAEE